MQQELESWNDHWKELEQLPMLPLFSRGYLLLLADLVIHKKAERVVSILRTLFPSASPKLEQLVIDFIEETPAIKGRNWLSTEQLFIIIIII